MPRLNTPSRDANRPYGSPLDLLARVRHFLKVFCPGLASGLGGLHENGTSASSASPRDRPRRVNRWGCCGTSSTMVVPRAQLVEPPRSGWRLMSISVSFARSSHAFVQIVAAIQSAPRRPRRLPGWICAFHEPRHDDHVGGIDTPPVALVAAATRWELSDPVIKHVARVNRARPCPASPRCRTLK